MGLNQCSTCLSVNAAVEGMSDPVLVNAVLPSLLKYTSWYLMILSFFLYRSSFPEVIQMKDELLFFVVANSI